MMGLDAGVVLVPQRAQEHLAVGGGVVHDEDSQGSVGHHRGSACQSACTQLGAHGSFLHDRHRLKVLLTAAAAAVVAALLARARKTLVSRGQKCIGNVVQWQTQREGGATANPLGGNCQCPAMLLDNALGDKQSQSTAPACLQLVAVVLHSFSEQIPHLLRRHTLPCVRDRQHQHAALHEGAGLTRVQGEGSLVRRISAIGTLPLADDADLACHGGVLNGKSCQKPIQEAVSTNALRRYTYLLRG
mmetsp:Transcript_10387/g.17412  ORF Transcript_10387/g.17412 Transcript_10387/m.17412 type:complete len:245 (-) Transcript_10387:1270-2004(-)